MWTVILLLVLGAVLLWLASRLTWAWSRQLTPLRGTIVVTQRGSEVAPALIPLAFLALAAVAAILAIGGWGRRLVGVLVGIAGLAAVWVGIDGLPGVFATHPVGYPLSQVVTGHALAIVAGLPIVLAGLLIVRNANGMPRLGGNYQTPSATRRRTNPDTELWEALSEGSDPTVDPTADPTTTNLTTTSTQLDDTRPNQ
ncbi:MAG TPA: Trp biosynthesis-associated membrane protein [Pseudonocardiaceae bacterium]|nr:Trp biosynthesis-associated membrane protein [Pseudonocardiaceae bacterium]